jgi:glycosyltransferase involved in cell wall biosynthesis
LNVTFTGYVENLPEYIAAADLAIVPLTKGGGTRIKILEYMACGKPVVSTCIGAEGLDVENGKEIILVDDIFDSFVEKVVELIDNKELRIKVGENARKKVIEKYNWYKACREARKIYLDDCDMVKKRTREKPRFH